MSGRDPFATRMRRPDHLADERGGISAADEIAEVGTDVATAEALTGRLPTRRAQ